MDILARYLPIVLNSHVVLATILHESYATPVNICIVVGDIRERDSHCKADGPGNRVPLKCGRFRIDEYIIAVQTANTVVSDRISFDQNGWISARSFIRDDAIFSIIKDSVSEKMH